MCGRWGRRHFVSATKVEGLLYASLSTRRMKELGVGTAEGPVTLGPVEATPRALQSPELSAPSEPTDD